MLSGSTAQRGGGLIEVLISMIIVTIGVLGTLSMQNRSMQFNRGAMLESKAAILAADMIDRIRSNPTMASSYLIGLNDLAPNYTDCLNPKVECTLLELANFDLATWREEISASLPGGAGEVKETAGPGDISIFTITIQYVDKRLEESSAYSKNFANEVAPKQVTYRTSI